MVWTALEGLGVQRNYLRRLSVLGVHDAPGYHSVDSLERYRLDDSARDVLYDRDRKSHLQA